MTIAHILRGCVSGVMNAILLFLIAQPRYSKKITGWIIVFVFSIDIFTSLIFYNMGELTLLAKFDIILFLALAIALKPFVKDSVLQWLFHFLTAFNLYFIVAFGSYYLCDFFPYPIYANSFVRFGLYLMIIFLYGKILRPIYRTITEDWKMYFVLVLSITANFVYYIVSSKDIEATLNDRGMELLLLSVLTIFVYVTIFYLLQKDRTRKNLREEKLYFEQMAYKDALTGVGNRNGYEKYAQELESISNKDNICVGVFDINDLKIVNDTMGHSIGDQYIYNCCQIICKAHKTSAVFRMGGDEFLTISANAPDNFIEESINSLKELMVDANNKNTLHKTSIAYGYARYNAKEHPTMDALKNEADSLMYANKQITKAAKL